MYFPLVHLATALYAFSSRPAFHAGENEIGLAPLLSTHPITVVNTFTDYTRSFTSSFFALKLFGAPLPTRTVLSADTGQVWDPYLVSLNDVDPPPASTVYTPASPVPHSSPSRSSAILDIDTVDSHQPTQVAYDDDIKGPVIASELADAAVLDQFIAFRFACFYAAVVKDRLVVTLDILAHSSITIKISPVECVALMILALTVLDWYVYLAIYSTHSTTTSSSAASFESDISKHVVGTVKPALSSEVDIDSPALVSLSETEDDELVLLPKDIALPEAEAGELDLTPADVPLPDPIDNELDLAPEDIPLPEAQDGELSLAPEDIPLPVAVANELDDPELVLSPEYIALPEAEVGELDLTPEVVPLPDSIDNELDLAPEDIPLPKAQDGELSLAPEDVPLPVAVANELVDQKLVLSPEYTALPEAEVGELDLAPEDVPLPDPTDNELDLAPEDVPLPKAQDGELSLAPEDVPLPVAVANELVDQKLVLSPEYIALPEAEVGELDLAPEDVPLPDPTDNELDLAPEDVPLPEALAGELSLVPEDVPLPLAIANELDISPEDVPLPDTDEDDLSPRSEHITAQSQKYFNHVIVSKTAPLYPRADNIAYEPATPCLAGKVDEIKSFISLFPPPKHTRVPSREETYSQILADESSDFISGDHFSVSELHVTKQPIISTEANKDDYDWNAVEEAYDWTPTSDAFDWSTKGELYDKSSIVDEILGDLFSVSEEECQPAIPNHSAIAGLSTLANTVFDGSNAICAKPANTHLFSTQSSLAPAGGSPVRALVDCELPAFDLDLPAFELAPQVSVTPVTPVRTCQKGRLLDGLRPFDFTPRTLDLAYFELSPRESFSDISEDIDVVSLVIDFFALSPMINDTTRESFLDAELPLFLPPSDSFDEIAHRAVIDGDIPIFVNEFILPADWEDVDDRLELALADVGGNEKLLEVDQPPHLLPSRSFDDIVQLVVVEGRIPPCPGDEFAALRTAYRKLAKEDGENIQDVPVPTLPTSDFIEEGSTPLFSRAIRRPMDTKPVTSASFAPVESSTPISHKAKDKRRAMPSVSESEDSASGSALPSDKVSSDVTTSAPSTFYREPTPGFDFDLDGPGPSSPFSHESSSSEWPSPRTPVLFFAASQTDNAAPAVRDVEVASGSPRSVETGDFDKGKPSEVLWYELGRHDDGEDVSC